MKNNRRHYIQKTGALAVWVAPVLTAVTLPVHAQTSRCVSLPTIPASMPGITIGDRRGVTIDPIDLTRYGGCSITFPTCDSYTATGLPRGLSISNLGLITGSYNANGTEVFTITVSAILCGRNTIQGIFLLTITDDG